MKQVIIMVSMIVLGVAIWNFVIGDHPSSMKSVASGVWREEITRQNTYP